MLKLDQPSGTLGQKYLGPNLLFTTDPSKIHSMIHAAGHDLRGPVFIINGYASLLEKNLSSEKDLQKLNQIKQAAKKLESLINSTVELIDIQTVPPRDYQCNLFESVIKEAKNKLCTEIAASPNVEFTLTLEETEINFSQQYLFLIFKHLIQNALIHNSSVENLKIEITTKKVNQFILIEITDNGIGMDLSQSPGRILEPFYRHSNESKRAGIGLAIVKTIVDRTACFMDFDSVPSMGTKVKICLPI